MLAGVSIVALVSAWSAGAQTTAAAGNKAAKTAPSDATTQVTVEGKHKEVADRIDRRVYDVSSDPDAATGTSADILGKLPSVQVTPSGAVSLRGDRRVLVLVDGKYPANGNAVIQDMPASSIERIEVMTTPSAQYAADAPGGVINIITKKRAHLGVSGEVSARVDNVRDNLHASSVVTKGPWTLDTRLVVMRAQKDWRQNSVLTAPFAMTDTGRYGWAQDAVIATANLTYRFDDKRSLAFDSEARSVWARLRNDDQYRSDDISYDQAGRGRIHDQYAYVEMIYEDNDTDTGRHLTLDTWHVDYDTLTRNAYRDNYLSAPGGAAVYGHHIRRQGPEDDIKLDYERRMDNGDQLTAGAEWARIEADIATIFNDSGAVAGPYPDGFTQSFSGARTTLDAYVTYQHDVGAWTVLPGLRLEQERIDAQGDVGSASPDFTHVLPSLHLAHALGQGKLRIAYNRKIERPQITQYNPSIAYYGSRSAYQGNADLKSPTTDSFEIGYDLNKGDTLTGVTVYSRITHDLLTTYSRDIGDNVVLTQDVNAGNARQTGAELSLKAPLPHHFKYMLDVNLFAEETPYYNGVDGATHSQMTYTGNGYLEYDRSNGEQYQVSFGVSGRRLSVQGYAEPTSHVDLSWSRPLTKKVSLSVSASDIFKGQDRIAVVNTPSLRGRVTQFDNEQVWRVGLAWKFGGGS
ncbi:MAG: TonB-dependent receptor [Asticcacaulis sp.]|uniref:TonB-dependent receptor n=1 Tax=Asticcacaulis sp. TaxID=1872648 RepID=UPI003F7C60CF